jgi:hypothetical protein
VQREARQPITPTPLQYRPAPSRRSGIPRDRRSGARVLGRGSEAATIKIRSVFGQDIRPSSRPRAMSSS